MMDVPFDAVDEADLLALVAARAPETRTLEFKREIGRGNTATAEFLRDLTAMANAQGGDLLIGVIEEEGVAAAVPGVAIPSLDDEGQRFENIIRSCVEPRLANYLPEDQVIDHIASGRLIRVLEDWCEPFAGYHLYYPNRRHPSPAFALLLEVLRYRG